MSEQRRVRASQLTGNRRQRRAKVRAERRATSALSPTAATSVTLALGLGLHASAARADTFPVTTTLAWGAGSLRESIISANNNPGPDVVDATGVSGQISLFALYGEMPITDETTVLGPGSGSLTIDGGNSSRIFNVHPSSRVPVTISGLKLVHGQSSLGGAIYAEGADLTLIDLNITQNSVSDQGGGVFALGDGNLTISDSVIASNSAGTGAGGGIFVVKLVSGAQLAISDSKVTGNTAQQGAGMHVARLYDDVHIDRSTFSLNDASGEGGGLHIQELNAQADVEIRATTFSYNQAGVRGGAIKLDWIDGDLRIQNSTLSGNQSVSNGGALAADFGVYYDFLYSTTEIGGGSITIASSTLVANSSSGGDSVWAAHGTVALENSVLANNAGTDIAQESGGGLTFDHCLIESPGAISIAGSGNLVSVDPKLGPLQNNGGPTFTHLPADDSPLVNAGDPNFAPPPPVDQRGFSRVADSIIDIGAVELVSLAPTISAIGNQTTNEDTATSAIAFVVDDPDDDLSDLTIDATSSDDAVIPDQNIVFGGSGANRTLTLTPVANASGQTTITLSVGDGTHTTEATFVVTVTAVNDPPGISAIGDPTIMEDAATSALAFTVSDSDTSLGSLTVSGSSSNQSVVADSGIELGGSGASRTVKVTPVANASGSATITLTVGDGASTATETFVVTVTGVNDAPEISSFEDQSTNEDTALGPLAVTVSDDGSAGTLTLTGSSSDTSLVADSAITFGGSGASRTVTITPAANANGTATVTLTVSDGTLTDSVSFDVTIEPVNDPPTFSTIPDQSIDEDDTTGPVAFTVGDIDNSASSLQITADSANDALIPDANVVLGGSGTHRTVTVTPVPNLTGSSTIEVSVSDGATTTSGTFEVVVGAANDAPAISPIDDQSIAVNGTTDTLAFTIGDVETAASSLTVTAMSSNQMLVPTANIVLAGGGANRTVTVTPAPNESGVAHITISVGDGTATSTESFAVTVSPESGVVSEPSAPGTPTISVIDPVSVDEDSATDPIAFVVGDTDTDASSLEVTATSSNTAIVPDGAIVLSGSGANRTVTITPAENMNGSVLIKLTVSDGTHSSTRSFALIINPADDAPTIASISDQYIRQGESTDAVEFVVSDADGAAAALSVTAASSSQLLLPNSGITLGGAGGTRTINLTPNPERFGSTDVTVTVSDGTTSATATFTLHVSEATPDELTDAGETSSDGGTDAEPEESDAGEPRKAKKSSGCSVAQPDSSSQPPRAFIASILGVLAFGARRRRRKSD